MKDILKSYKFNLKPSPSDDRDYKIEQILNIGKPLATTEVIPDFIVPNNVLVGDQKDTSMCTSFTESQIARIFHWLETKESKEFSEGFSYANRDENGHQGEGDITRNVLKQWKKNGICEKQYFPQIGTYPQMKAIFNKLSDKVFENAYKHRIKSFYRVTKDKIEQTMYKYQLPLFVGIYIYHDAILNSYKDGIINVPASNDKNLGGHAVTLIGTKTIGGKKYYVMVNSWDTDIGDNGIFYLDPDYPIIESWLPLDYVPTEVKMTIGSNEYFVNGVSKTMDTAPMIVDNRTFIPVRFVSEAFGYEVIWHNESKEVEVKEYGFSYFLKIGSNKILETGGYTETECDVAPFINSDGRTMIPLRSLFELMGYSVVWNAAERSVTVSNIK